MALVEWSRLTGEQCESVLGVLLLRRYPHARRIRPSRGDRGIDVYVPTGDGWRVTQIKSYTGALTSSRKRHIADSWAAFIQFVENEGLPIAEWRLLRPENPTWEDEEWLTDLTEGASWPCSWGGIDHCEDLAAKYPDVIDYYLRDGKDRVDNTVRTHLAAAGFAQKTGGDSVAAAASEDTLRAVSDAINALDPHFYYDFAVQRRPDNSSSSWPPPVSPPSTTELLVASLMRSDEARAITFHVYARFEQATEERPIPLNFSITAEEGSPEYEAWTNFVDYGLAPRTSIPTAKMNLDLPGELGALGAEGRLRVGPTANAEQRTWTVRILDEAGDPIASADLVGPPPTWGMSGRGWSLDLHDPNDAIALTLRVDTHNNETHCTLSHLPLAGKTPHQLRRGLEVAAAFHGPHSYEILVAGGPPIAAPMPIKVDANPAFAQVMMLLDALSAVQRFTHDQLVLPAAELIAEQAPFWIIAAALLSGKVVSAAAAPTKSAAGGRTTGDMEQVIGEFDLEVLVGDKTVPTGRRVLSRCDMRVSAIDMGEATLIPEGPAQLVLLAEESDEPLLQGNGNDAVV